MKKHFLTGLAILLPAVVTFLILAFLINIITKPFLGSVVNAFSYYDIFNKPFLFLSGPTALLLASKIIILVAIVLIALLVGFVGQLFLVKLFRSFGDFLIHRIPVINKIYKAAYEVVQTLLVGKGEAKTNFSNVVLVRFPHANTYSLGLITNTNDQKSDEETKDHVSVFVPGTPNPTMGFMLLFPKTQIIPIDIKVEDALKFVVSCGVILPNFDAARLRFSSDISAK
jgi:uncharacterized membrane protein